MPDIIVDSSEYRLLEGVVVNGKTKLMEQKIDRLIFNVQNSLTASTGTGLDAISKTPGVIVGQKGISLAGKSTLAIMVNDRLIRLAGDDIADYLRSIPAENIALIEIITNPPARYSAEGNSGLLNIKLKKPATEGLNGTIRLGYTQTTFSAADMGGTFNYQKGKTNVYGNLTYTNGASAPVEHLVIYYPDQVWDQYNNRKDRVNSTVYQFGADYAISKNSVIGFIYNGTYRLPGISELIHTGINRKTGESDSTIKTTGETSTQINSNAFNVNFVTSLNAAKKIRLNVDADYLAYANNKERDFVTADFLPDGSPAVNKSNNKSFANQDIRIKTIKADINRPFKWCNISAGAKISLIDNLSSNLFTRLFNGNYQTDTGNSNSFRYKEDIKGAYITGDKTIGKWTVQFGLRVEDTHLSGNSITVGEVNKNYYVSFFPTAYLLYNYNDNNAFTFSYGKRINRPGYWELNPFRWYLNEYQYSEGNPFLRPSYSNNIELGYSLKSKYYFTLYFEGITNYSDQVILTNPVSKITSFLRKNIGNSANYGIRITTEDSPLPWWTISNEVVAFNYSFRSSYNNVTSKYRKWSAYLSSSHSIVLNSKKNMSCEITGWYQAPQQSGYDYLRNTYGINVGWHLQLLKNRLSLAVAANDILKTDKQFIITNALGNYSTSNNYYDLRRIKITATLKLGSNKIRNKRTRTIGNGDEKNRIG